MDTLPKCYYCGKYLRPWDSDVSSKVVNVCYWPPYPGDQVFFHKACEKNRCSDCGRYLQEDESCKGFYCDYIN